MSLGKMNEAEKQLVHFINKGNIAEAQGVLSTGSVNVNCLDEHGMSPLMHAAYKGQADMVELLLAHGADVNSNYHEHNYTTLMFSCLAGSVEVSKILLEAGAKVDVVNSLGRTATQMGAFVGQHECVSLINNFISPLDLQYYTKPQGLEKEGKLQSKLVPSLHRFITITNLNPVKLIYYLNNHKDLIENYKSVYKVLDLKAESYVKLTSMNEVMGMKMHYFACTVKACGRWSDGLDGKDGIDGLIKSLVRGRASDGFAVGIEDFIRQAIKEFDYPQCTIFRQLVSSLSHVEKGMDPTALTALTQAINGLQSADFSNSCSVCGEKKSIKKCAACKKADYCSVYCQKLHWGTHRKHCKRLAEEYKKEVAAEEEAKRQEAEEKALQEADKQQKETKENGEVKHEEATRVGEEKPAETARVGEEKPVESARVREEKPVETASVGEEKPVESARVGEEKPLESAMVREEKPVETASIGEEKPVKTARKENDNTGNGENIDNDMLDKTKGNGVTSIHGNIRGVTEVKTKSEMEDMVVKSDLKTTEKALDELGIKGT